MTLAALVGRLLEEIWYVCIIHKMKTKTFHKKKMRLEAMDIIKSKFSNLTIKKIAKIIWFYIQFWFAYSLFVLRWIEYSFENEQSDKEKLNNVWNLQLLSAAKMRENDNLFASFERSSFYISLCNALRSVCQLVVHAYLCVIYWITCVCD